MKTANNIQKANKPVIATREPVSDIIKGACDTSNIDATRENAISGKKSTEEMPAQYHQVNTGKADNENTVQNSENDIKNPSIRGI